MSTGHLISYMLLYVGFNSKFVQHHSLSTNQKVKDDGKTMKPFVIACKSRWKNADDLTMRSQCWARNNSLSVTLNDNVETWNKHTKQ